MLTIQDILYFKKDQECLKKWDPVKPLFICGTSGTGKSTLANLIFQEKEFSINLIDSSFIKRGKCVSDYILDVLGKCSISMMFSSNTLNGIIIDDVDVFDSHDNIITSIYSIIKNNNTVSPIILVCNKQFISSNIQKIMKLCYVVEVPTPSIQRMISYGSKYNQSILTRCAHKSKGDWNSFNRLLTITNPKDKMLDIESRIISGNITKHTEHLIKYDYDISTLFNLCHTDYSLLALLLYTNSTELLLKNNMNLTEMYRNIQLFDIVEKNIEIDWSMIDLSILFGCIRPLFELNAINTKKHQVKYTHVFSVSTSQINHKKLLKKVDKETGKSINILAALLFHSFKNDIAYRKCKELNLKEFTLNELQKIIITYYKPCKFTVGNKKILNNFL